MDNSNEFTPTKIDNPNKFIPIEINHHISGYFLRGGREGNKDQRLGQWFYNTFDRSGLPFPALFYAKDGEAARLIWSHYCKEESNV